MTTPADRVSRSRAQERKIAQRYGGTLNAGSGNGRRKGDVREDDFLIECKRTDGKRSISIKHDDLRAISKHAAMDNRTPVLQFELNGESFVILHEADFRGFFG